MGGRILKNVLYIFCGKEKVIRITNIVSNLNTILLTMVVIYMSIIFKNPSYLFALTYIWIINIKENKRYSIRKKFYKILQNYIEIK